VSSQPLGDEQVLQVDPRAPAPGGIALKEQCEARRRRVQLGHQALERRRLAAEIGSQALDGGFDGIGLALVASQVANEAEDDLGVGGGRPANRERH
jgi:hypothetical protein